jgi:DNA modification methylase
MIPPEYINQIVTGDARVLAERIPDASVDLIFTDPVYDRIEDYAWLAEIAARVLKDDKALLIWIATTHLETVMAAMHGRGLTYRWQLIHYKPGRVKEKFGAAGFCKYESLLWYDKGRLPRRRWMDVFQSMPFQSTLPMELSHEWAKDPDALADVVEHFSKVGEVVYDPFSGGGTVPAVCRILHRNWIASEIDEGKAARARARVEATQAMHPVFLEEQHAMELAS